MKTDDWMTVAEGWGLAGLLQALIFDLDDTLLWDEKSIGMAFEKTCAYASEKYALDAKNLEVEVRQAASKLYATYDFYPFVQMIGINPFEGLWGTFDDRGEEFKRMHKVIPSYQKDAWTKGLSAMGIEDEVLGQELAHLFVQYRVANPCIYQETFDLLNAVKGKYKLVLLTNGAPSLQGHKLRLTPALRPYFDHVVISGEFGVGKPDEAIFHHVLQLCDLSADQVMMVGDNRKTDILGANRVGMPSVWINHHGDPPSDIVPTYEIEKLLDLLQIL